MEAKASRIDECLAAALRGDAVAWEPSEPQEPIVARILYHGIAALLADRAEQIAYWPRAISDSVRKQATGQAMWELRHGALLAELLAEFSRRAVAALLVKGTATAYDLYPHPAQRSRGDSDLWIASSDLDRARTVLAEAGFARADAEETTIAGFAYQEGWVRRCDGLAHHIDLHWQLMNAPALSELFDFADCSVARINLPRLSADAFTMNRVHIFLHTAAHRKMHLTSPYFVDGTAYFGGDRLIWLYDIHLLASGFSKQDWSDLCDAALAKGLAAVCLEALSTAARMLKTPVPESSIQKLSKGHSSKAADYLLGSRQLSRAWQDLAATRGLSRKVDYVRARALPPPSFMRAKYPALAKQPLVLLYARRVIDLMRPRPPHTAD